ncbi:MAG: AMP-binding protein [Marmoricola sp.]
MALNIADLFEHAVDAAPDNRAVKIGDRVVTFAELETQSNQLAHFLASRGVGEGDHVHGMLEQVCNVQGHDRKTRTRSCF